MVGWIIFLLEANVAFVLLFVLYYFGFRHLTFYTVNRVFLVFGIIFSGVFPLLDSSYLLKLLNSPEMMSNQLTAIIPDLHVALVNQVRPLLNFQEIVQVLYCLGVLVLFVIFLIRLQSLYLLHRTSTPGSLNGNIFREVKEEINPFSFWQTIYLNPSMHKRDELNLILLHEKVHVQQWHTLDILLAEVCKIFFWFNPAVWLLSKVIKENLEFITDQKMISSGVNRREYQYSLIKNSTLAYRIPMVHNFNLMKVKSRVAMMNKRGSARIHLLKYICILPAICIFLFFYASMKDKMESLNGAVFGSKGRVISKADSTLAESSSIIYLLDGKEVDFELINHMKPEDISAVNVVKKEGIGGTIEVTSRK